MNQTLAAYTVAKMDHAENWGDWHDKPVRWILTGPDARLPQKFQTRRDAEAFRSKIKRGHIGF